MWDFRSYLRLDVRLLVADYYWMEEILCCFYQNLFKHFRNGFFLLSYNLCSFIHTADALNLPRDSTKGKLKGPDIFRIRHEPQCVVSFFLWNNVKSTFTIDTDSFRENDFWSLITTIVWEHDLMKLLLWFEQVVARDGMVTSSYSAILYQPSKVIKILICVVLPNLHDFIVFLCFIITLCLSLEELD